MRDYFADKSPLARFACLAVTLPAASNKSLRKAEGGQPCVEGRDPSTAVGLCEERKDQSSLKDDMLIGAYLG